MKDELLSDFESDHPEMAKEFLEEKTKEEVLWSNYALCKDAIKELGWEDEYQEYVRQVYEDTQDGRYFKAKNKRWVSQESLKPIMDDILFNVELIDKKGSDNQAIIKNIKMLCKEVLGDER